MREIEIDKAFFVIRLFGFLVGVISFGCYKKLLQKKKTGLSKTVIIN